MLISSLKPGDMIGFRIVPDQADGQINANRWGMFKALRITEDGLVTIAPYAEIFDREPKLGWLSRPKPLTEKRFPALLANRGGVPTITTPIDGKAVNLPDAHVIKSDVKFTSFEADTIALLKEGVPQGSYMAWASVSLMIDHEDRSIRDRTAWEADITRRRAEDEARWAEQRAREAERLKGITLDQLSREVIFEQWDTRTKIVPARYTKAARKRMNDLIKALSALGPKPKRGDVRLELKACVEWFNSVDGTMGYAIETVEREDIYAVLEEICWACKQKPLIQEIDDWRDW